MKSNSPRPTVFAAGMIIFAKTQPLSFLLLKHKDRWDLPKGHAEPGENLLETALRETEEETGIRSDQLQMDAGFQYSLEYSVKHSKRGKYQKGVHYFLAFVDEQVDIQLTEHIGYQWFEWPTGPIQQQTIDPLLAAVRSHFDKSGIGR